jgi:hypothetical protein
VSYTCEMLPFNFLRMNREQYQNSQTPPNTTLLQVSVAMIPNTTRIPEPESLV